MAEGCPERSSHLSFHSALVETVLWPTSSRRIPEGIQHTPAQESPAQPPTSASTRLGWQGRGNITRTHIMLLPRAPYWRGGGDPDPQRSP